MRSEVEPRTSFLLGACPSARWTRIPEFKGMSLGAKASCHRQTCETRSSDKCRHETSDDTTHGLGQRLRQPPLLLAFFIRAPRKMPIITKIMMMKIVMYAA